LGHEHSSLACVSSFLPIRVPGVAKAFSLAFGMLLTTLVPRAGGTQARATLKGPVKNAAAGEGLSGATVPTSASAP